MSEIKSKLEENKTKGSKLKVFCSQCNREINHLVLQSVDTSDTEIYRFSDSVLFWSDNYQIIRCQGCDLVSFRHLSYFSEHEHEYSDGTTSYLYPKRAKDMRKVKDFNNIPDNVIRIYKETVDSFNNGSFLLCAAGLRATIESICLDKNIKSGLVTMLDEDGNPKRKKDGSIETKRSNSLDGKISGLHESNMLTQKHAEILHEHRYLGNDAIHQIKMPSRTQLILGIEIIEHTLESLYEIPEKGEQLNARRKKV
ncbi:MAG: DUF4145 domain-containing protein [Pseudanabaena sp. CAN_BIN31]|nr:DUF4145 domain-containing protein [Pseudanabaena sp. CAN_BIN31]